MSRFFQVGLALGLVVALMLALTGSASAHETRTVGNGQYEFVVGFLTEPAYQGYPNGVSLAVRTKADRQPVEGVEKTLKVEIIQGSDKMTADLKTVFRTPGSYKAEFIPTKPGVYKFRFFGKVNDVNIDETFESGPGRFDEVQSAESVQFPKLTNTNGDAAALTTRLQSAEAQARAALEATREAENRTNTALLVGAAGVVVGIAGLGVGIAGFAARRR